MPAEVSKVIECFSNFSSNCSNFFPKYHHVTFPKFFYSETVTIKGRVFFIQYKIFLENFHRNLFFTCTVIEIFVSSKFEKLVFEIKK